MLKDLDLSGDLINRAKENMEDLIPRVPLARSMPIATTFTIS